jgi:uncharacterized protein (DUF58 family)
MRAKLIKPFHSLKGVRSRANAAANGSLLLTQRKIYILPTGAGIFFGALLLIMLVGAINYNNSLGFMLTFLLAGLNVISILYTYRNLLRLQISVRNIAPVFAGETLAVPVLLDNAGQLPRYSVYLQFPKQDAIGCDVPANGWTQVQTALRSKTRGQHPLPQFRIQSVFPLGLFRAWSYAHFETTYLVYPRPAKRSGLPLEYLYRPKQTGDKGRGSDDFAGLRNYHQGDSLRHIHWKTVAKDQGLHTKQFGGDRSDELWLDWRTLEHLDKEARICQLTRWVIDAEQGGMNYGLWIPGTRLTPHHGDAHKHNCLRALALLQ